MKIAVNYENGQIFQHFGQTKTFKVYTVENNAVTGTELVPGAPEGHHALGRQLAAMQVDVVICGSLGMPMLELLQGAGKTLCRLSRKRTHNIHIDIVESVFARQLVSLQELVKRVNPPENL